MTKKAAEILARKYEADLEEIKDLTNRKGVAGYLRAGRDAIRKKLTEIEETKYNPANYDLVLVGTPIWGWNMSVPIRTYLVENRGKFKKVAFFCTMSGSGDKQAFEEMEKITKKKPIKTWTFLTAAVARGELKEYKF